MSAKTVQIRTRDGVADCRFVNAPDKGRHPAVILYMDAFGVRPALCEMADRLASNGYQVLLPDLYYRSGPSLLVVTETVYKEGPERDRVMQLVRSINNKLVMEDTASLLEFLKSEATVDARRVGCVGYCMGGGFALSAAGTFPEQIAAAASLHGARLATGQPDSPHLLAPKMRASIYVGIAGIDPHFTSEDTQRLESALQAAGVKHKIEVYPEVKHGFAVNDMPAYDRAASERHWQEILKLFEENLMD